jgi:hypothetical protein
LLRKIRERRDNNFPRRYSSEEVAAGQASALQSRYGREKKPAAALSGDSGVLERTAKNHLSGANCMRLEQFFNACQVIPELKSWGLYMMGAETKLDPEFEQNLQGLIQTYYSIKEQQGETP